MPKPREKNSEPVKVPFAATPAGEPPSINDWANPSVWTERMLTALQQGVRGGKWHTLIDKVYAPLNLFAASRHVIGNGGAAGVDHQTVEAFLARQPKELGRLHESLRTDQYRPQAVRREWIPKPGSKEQRPLGIPTVRDRVVQTALLHVLEPIFDITFSAHSYGFRHGRGCHHALERVEELLDASYVYVVDADLKSYFDTIPKPRLLARVREKVSDQRVVRLIEMYLEQGVLDGLREWTPETGTPQGAVLSPLLANIYLNPLDHLLADAGFAAVRYADDFVILCKTREDAAEALAFRGDLRLPRGKSLTKFKDAVREKTKRTSGQCLHLVCARLTSQLRGWFTYFRHSYWTVFRTLDGWIRGRLRSILRKRHGRRGRARGTDHQRWPNHFFDAHGLYSLHAAYGWLVQSSRR
jgi:RNA-directed DNA polymerase